MRHAFWPQAQASSYQFKNSISKQSASNSTSPASPPQKTTNLTMPPKQRTTAAATSSTTTSTPAKTHTYPAGSKGKDTDAQQIVQSVWNKYVQKTPQRVKLLDTFMAFLIVVGALQFLYVVIVGNFVCLPLRLSSHTYITS
jgi:hypothetical protein